MPEVVRRLGSIVRKNDRAQDIARTTKHALQKLVPSMSKPVRGAHLRLLRTRE